MPIEQPHGVILLLSHLTFFLWADIRVKDGVSFKDGSNSKVEYNGSLRFFPNDLERWSCSGQKNGQDMQVFPEFPGSEMAGFIYGCIDTYKDKAHIHTYSHIISYSKDTVLI